MKFLDKMTLKRKMILILLLPVILSLTLYSGIVIYNDLKEFKDGMVRHLTVLAKTMGSNILSSLVSKDILSANKILASLENEPQIQFAAVYDSEGRLFAEFSKTQNKNRIIPNLKNHENLFFSDHFEALSPIQLEGKEIGKIFLYAHVEGVKPQVKKRTKNVILILLFTLFIAYILSLFLQGIVSKPIRFLSDIVDQISQVPDYSVRAPEYSGKDEIGKLYSGFNEMLSQVQNRNQELIKYRDQLETLINERTTELEKTQAELLQKERLALLGELSAKVSHELRNPLGTVRTGLFTIEKLIQKGDYKVEPTLEIIERNIIRCNLIIDDLLDFANPNLKKTEDIEIDSWLYELLGEVNFPDGVKIEGNFLSEATVRIDRERFRRVVLNVLENSFHALSERKNHDIFNQKETVDQITIKTLKIENRVEIYFIDNGLGISPADLEKIFTPLFSTKSFGVGLGLSIIKEIMEEHEGGVEIKSQPQQSTTVKLWLPLTN